VRTIALVAGSVFKESVRDRVPYSMVAFAALLILASYLIGQLTAGQDMKIIKDLGLAAISWFGLVIAIFIGIGLVSKEVEKRSVYGILTKPVTRGQFILGKYLGLVITLVVNLSAMTVAFALVLAYMNATTAPGVKAAWPAPALDPALLTGVVLTIVELMIVTAIALFFSTYSSPLLSALLTLGLWVVGHFSQDLKNLGEVTEVTGLTWVGRGLYYLLPNLAMFNVRAEVAHGLPVPATGVAMALAYAATYIALLLTGAVAIFRQRDFK
jgi:ABC-type transport system involved in multi-copper enzyme maturation permease subunit